MEWLPIAAFAFNLHVHSSTGYSLFYLMYSYKPQFHVLVALTDILVADEWIARLQDAHEDASAAL